MVDDARFVSVTRHEVEDVAARFIRNVAEAMRGQRVSDVAKQANMTEGRLRQILERRSYPDLVEIRALEIALDADLWPWPHD